MVEEVGALGLGIKGFYLDSGSQCSGDCTSPDANERLGLGFRVKALRV